MLKRILLTAVAALTFGLLCWVPFLYLALTRKRRGDWSALIIFAVLAVIDAVAMFAVADRVDNVSGTVGLFMVVLAAVSAVVAWVMLRVDPKDSAALPGRAYLS